MSKRIVVVGGDATGMSAANTALRHSAEGALEVVVLERGHYVSYSACGIPYWIAGDVEDGDELIARSPEQHREAGIDLRMRAEVTAIDRDEKSVSVRGLDDGDRYELSYDELVIATGATPTVPPLEGSDAEGVFGVQSLEDGEAIIKDLAGLDGDGRSAVVVGAGYIGVEMAEAMLSRGFATTILDMAPEPFTQIDPDMGALVREAMEGMGITVLTGTSVEGFDVGEDGRVRAVRAGDAVLPADVVILGLGVKPNVDLARDAGLTIGESGGIVTDLRMRAGENVWAGGDCVETQHRISGKGVNLALGTHANKHGRIIGTNLAGGYGTFPGVLGTAISKVCNLEIARTGLGEAEAAAAGFGYEATTVESTTTAGYFPGAREMTVKILAERRSGRLLGAQIVGREGSAKRIDVFATALWNGMAVEEMTFMDLSYAPPFSPVWDAVLVAARKAAQAVQADIPASPV